MRRLLAIAGLAVRASIRSRLVVALLLILLGVVIGLPRTVQSDGTPEGYVRVVMGYTMGLASLLLSLTALWSGALSIAREVDEKQIQLVCSKPVHRLEIWAGKWLGLSAVHAVLLALCAGATLLTLHLNLRGERFTDAQRAQIHQNVMMTRRALSPQPVDVEAAARAEVQRRLQQQELPPGLTPEQALNNVQQELLARAHTIGPGEKKTWSFAIPARAASFTELRLKFRFSASQMGGVPVEGTWLIGPPGEPARYRQSVTNTADAVHFLTLRIDQPEPWRQFTVTYINQHPDPLTVFFSPRDGLELQLPAGSFAPNFVRAVGLVMIQLALLVAIGVTASTLFSTPVAALMALAAAIILRTSDYVGSLAREGTGLAGRSGEATGPGLFDAALRLFYQTLHTVLAPLQAGQPLDHVATGVWVDPARLAQAGVVQLLVYGGLLALLATVIFNRREVARPTP